MSVFLSSNLQCLINLMLKLRVSQYFKSVIKTIIIENNESFVEKETLSTKKRLTKKKKKKKKLVG